MWVIGPEFLINIIFDYGGIKKGKVMGLKESCYVIDGDVNIY